MNELFRAGVWHDLICDDGTASKFWSVKIVKNTHIRKWGALGTMGNEKVTTFDSPEIARKDAENLYLSKTRGGYRVKKPQLSVTTELVHTVDGVATLNSFIFRAFGVPFDFCKDQEAQIGHSFKFTPDGKLSDFDIECIERWINSDGEDGVYMTHRLLDHCVRQRLIPAGVYLIEV
jgi:predicted DNA-binding WGR domain protein